jgi:hypothetical protein
MQQAVRILAGLSFVGGFLGFAAFVVFIGKAQSAPQEAALSAMIVAPVVCLYVFARGVEMIANASKPSRDLPKPVSPAMPPHA